MYNFIKITLLLLSIAVLTSCQKHDTSPADPDKVTVTYNTALNGLTYHKGDTVNIDATIDYTGEINGVMVAITDTATDNILYQDDQDLHTDRFNLQRSWVDTYANTANLKVVITVAIANGTKFAENTVHFETQP